MLKALNSLNTTEEKLAALCKKYTELLEEHRVTQATVKQNHRKLSVVGGSTLHSPLLDSIVILCSISDQHFEGSLMALDTRFES